MRNAVKRMMVERTNSWNNKFKKLFTWREKNEKEIYLEIYAISK